MSKLFFNAYSFLILCFAVIGCSSGSDETAAIAPPAGTVNKITETSYNGGQVSTINYDFNYENGILKTISAGTAFRFEFVMDGNKIVQVKSVLNNVAGAVNNMLYDGINLKSITQADNSEKTEFTHSSNVVASERNFYSTNNSTWILSTTKNYAFNAALNMESQLLTAHQMSSQASKSSFEYDAKNNPFKNMNSYLRYLLQFETISQFSANNVFKQYAFASATSTTPIQTHYYIYVYNENGFPLSIKKYGLPNNTLISECVLSYN